MTKYDDIRKTLHNYYFVELPERVETTRKKVYEIMDNYDNENPGKSSYCLKSKLYEAISESIEPVIFENIPFYFETGALSAGSDGKFDRGAEHANGWLIRRNEHIMIDADKDAFELYLENKRSTLYAQCGIYVDMLHNGIPLKKCINVGLSGVYDELLEELPKCKTEKEKEFITCAMSGINALHKIQLKFADTAEKKGMTELAEISKRVPWEKPETFYEGLLTLAFMRKALGSLEGVGFSSFGRVDKLLAPLYESDIKKGVKEEEMLDQVSKFLLIWDCTFDRNKKISLTGGKYFEYELENSITLGGCDDDGKPFFSGVAKLFIEARNSISGIYPKMMLRYSKDSSDEYLELITKALLDGENVSLFPNDETIIPALVKSGADIKDARNYAVGGCWDALMPDVCHKFSGEYLNLITPLVWTIHNNFEKMERNKFFVENLENCETFDELYNKYLKVIERLMFRKAEPAVYISKLWDKMNPVCAFSALMEPCIPKHTDLTAGGGKYSRESVYFYGFADLLDSLLVIKKLCFDEKLCTVSQLFEECRKDWENEALRRQAISITSFGDSGEESSKLAGKLHDDLQMIAQKLPTSYGGKFRTGYNLYAETITVAKHLEATPNGRRKGDYLAQGITPTRYQKQLNIVDILSSFRYIDMSECAGNSSVTVTLPAGGMTKEKLVQFMRMVSVSNIQSIQPNVLSHDELLKAKKDPENYKHIIVRVAGFSAPFVSLPEEIQEDIISRNISSL